MKRFFLLLSLSILVFCWIGCGNENSPADESKKTIKDDPNKEVTAADTSSTGVYQEQVEETEETSLQDALTADSSPEEETESGMSFCDCVKKQKELSDLMLETEDDDVFDKTMAELEELKKGDCKILFSGKQNTIEEKQEHERKVKNCLN